MTIKTRPVTAEELLRKPDDGFRYELVRGELRKMAPWETSTATWLGRYSGNSEAM